MPTNVTPQYRKAEDQFREATTTQSKIAALQEMLSIMPKHKGTDHLKAQLRSRMSKLMAELEGPTPGSSGGRTEPFSLPKEGGGRATLIGPTNVGKSLILNQATGAKTKVGAYALSTQEPTPGMLPYEDVHIQMVDTPPISNPGTQGRLYGLLRSTDVFVIVVDLSMDVMEQIDEVFSVLKDWDFQLMKRDDEPDKENPWKSKPTVIVGNKADIPGALDQYQILEDTFSSEYPVVMASAEEDVGLDDMALEVFRALNVIRVYTKSPRQKLEEFDKTDPLVLPVEATVEEAAGQLHRDLGRSIKYAVLWGVSGKFVGQRVGREHQLTDGDIIEIHS
jgi:ribosome-interacting GTPase 1